MIDLHCHLLPGIDDGPEILEQSMALAKQAVRNGVTHAIVTPHMHHGRWDNTASSIDEVTNTFRTELNRKGIPLSIAYAAEVRIGVEVLQWVADQQIPYLGEYQGKKVMLLELPHSNIPLGTEKIIKWLIDRDILPLIAHPERNKDVIRRYEKLSPLVDMGCLFQVTAGSLIGRFGNQVQAVAQRLICSGLVSVLASDAHHAERRPVNLKEGYEAAIELIGESEARSLVYDVPLEIAAKKFMA
jgi:protein-tyrosine phosphatase